MSPILGIWASQISGRLWEPAGAYDALATVTVPSGGAASITFAGIPTGYKHLQIRYMAQTNRGTFGLDNMRIRVGNGSIDAGSNYSFHELFGDGASANANAGANQTGINTTSSLGTSASANIFGVGVLDILDYANIVTNKTLRLLLGHDVNGTISSLGGRVGLDSGNWRSTSAITTIEFAPIFGTAFNQYTQFALYGVK
jgi:hypothetical protein